MSEHNITAYGQFERHLRPVLQNCENSQKPMATVRG
jgi:hypothetical protein